MSGGNRRSLWYIIKHRDPEGIGISRKISQRESQQIDFILPILEYIIKHKKFYASELKQQFKNLNHKSVDRAITLLKKRNLIALHKIELKNKKIYKIKSIRELKKYQSELSKYRWFKIVIAAALQTKSIKIIDGFSKISDGFDKKLRRGIEKGRHYVSIPKYLVTIPLEIKNKPLYVKLTSLKKWPEPVSISEMKRSAGDKILDDYRRGNICTICFQENKLQYFVKRDEDRLCDFGHVNSLNLDFNGRSFDHEIFDSSKISKKLTDAMLNYQKREYLERKK